ncbi:TPA: hypothetical protein H4C30_004773 [Escherichia coli]|uniref:hypothetical protein n=1 Tax=Escherichia coli TaxID=562 RepID=UPI001767217E|nr:hypothetical protein [Escherichia coli]HAI6732724.1 hypothetical protein [Escherichia coli]HAL0160991.1 hypothetical protein [Escherichia coli]
MDLLLSSDRYANLKICMPVLSEWLADPFCVVDVFMSLVILPLQVAQPGFGFYKKITISDIPVETQ